MCVRLLNFLNRHDILYKYQFGFRNNHSTIHPIIHLLNHIADSNDKTTTDTTIALFLDLSKTFYGIRGTSNLWFKNYLSERKQYLEFNGIKSNLLNINCGVPQGSILGPILFLLYINDIQNSTSLNLLSFADDTTVFASSSNIPMLTNQINHVLTQIQKWLCTNKLSLNVSKTKYSVFNSSPNIPNIPENAFVLNNTTIKRTGTPTILNK